MRASCALRAARHAERLQSHQLHLQLIVPAGDLSLSVSGALMLTYVRGRGRHRAYRHRAASRC